MEDGGHNNEGGYYSSRKTSASGVPAWHDEGVESMMVSIEDTSRLRKLKKTEGETHISGA
jgi:hypothetical protein